MNVICAGNRGSGKSTLVTLFKKSSVTRKRLAYEQSSMEIRLDDVANPIEVNDVANSRVNLVAKLDVRIIDPPARIPPFLTAKMVEAAGVAQTVLIITLDLSGSPFHPLCRVFFSIIIIHSDIRNCEFDLRRWLSARSSPLQTIVVVGCKVCCALFFYSC
jgi:hypothetical protein